MALDEKLIAKHQALLGLTREEAIQLIEDDKRIDRGEKLFELDPELAKGAKRQGKHNANPPPTTSHKERKKPNPKRLKSALL